MLRAERDDSHSRSSRGTSDAAEEDSKEDETELPKCNWCERCCGEPIRALASAGVMPPACRVCNFLREMTEAWMFESTEGPEMAEVVLRNIGNRIEEMMDVVKNSNCFMVRSTRPGPGALHRLSGWRPRHVHLAAESQALSSDKRRLSSAEGAEAARKAMRK